MPFAKCFLEKLESYDFQYSNHSKVIFDPIKCHYPRLYKYYYDTIIYRFNSQVLFAYEKGYDNSVSANQKKTKRII